MKVIARGWQHTVYDLGNGRILKRQNSPWEATCVMLWDSFPYVHHPLWSFPGLYKEAKQASLRSLATIAKSPLEPWMLGNPRLLNESSYEQDKVTPLSVFFKDPKLSYDEGIRLIDSFVAFNEVLVRNNFIEKSFDIANNFGVDSKGRIVLVDLGELYADKASVEAQVRAKIWNVHYVLSGLPQRFHSYFLEKMDKTLTPLISNAI